MKLTLLIFSVTFTCGNHLFLGIQPVSLVHGIVLTILVGRYLISVYLALWYRARRNIRQFVGDVDAAAVACGFGRTFGNKVRYLYSALVF
jgi:hypothetical protein